MLPCVRALAATASARVVARAVRCKSVGIHASLRPRPAVVAPIRSCCPMPSVDGLYASPLALKGALKFSTASTKTNRRRKDARSTKATSKAEVETATSNTANAASAGDVKLTVAQPPAARTPEPIPHIAEMKLPPPPEGDEVLPDAWRANKTWWKAVYADIDPKWLSDAAVPPALIRRMYDGDGKPFPVQRFTRMDNDFQREIDRIVSERVTGDELRKQAKAGQAVSQFVLGMYYTLGIAGVPIDLELSRKWLLRAAETGVPHAQYYYGAMHQHSIGVNQDYETAAHWYGKAAAQGHVEAQSRLAMIHLAEWQDRGPEHRELAVRWLKAAVAQNHPFAKAMLGGLLLEEGKEKFLEAYTMMAESAYEQCNPTGQLILSAFLLEHGHKHRDDAIAEARRLLELSGHYENAEAQERLIELWQTGEYWEPDLEKAKYWLDRYQNAPDPEEQGARMDPSKFTWEVFDAFL